MIKVLEGIKGEIPQLSLDLIVDLTPSTGDNDVDSRIKKAIEDEILLLLGGSGLTRSTLEKAILNDINKVIEAASKIKKVADSRVAHNGTDTSQDDTLTVTNLIDFADLVCSILVRYGVLIGASISADPDPKHFYTWRNYLLPHLKSFSYKGLREEETEMHKTLGPMHQSAEIVRRRNEGPICEVRGTILEIERKLNPTVLPGWWRE